MSNNKFFWVDCQFGKSWEERKKLITTALESGAKGVIIIPEDLEKAKSLGKIEFIAASNDAKRILVGMGGEGDKTKKLPDELEDSEDLARIKELQAQGKKTCGYVEIHGKPYERLAALEAKISEGIIIVGRDWKVIPLENLIAELQKTDVEVVAGVKNVDEAKIAFETIEVGADGVLLQTQDIDQIKHVADLITRPKEELSIKVAIVKNTKIVSMGDRVCVDTASVLNKGEGMLVGSQANGLFLVHAETLETEYVAQRPFRVNAGAVHAYILTPGKKTKYLWELQGGDEILITDFKGNNRVAVVGRAKIEKRPLILIEAECEGAKYQTLLQNAETINLVSKDGKPISVTKLKKGDEILIHASQSGRHFGMAIEETIIEK